jgi:hypothetical protein
VETTRALEDQHGARRLAVRQSIYTTKRKYFKDYCISHYSLMSILHIAHSPIYIYDFYREVDHLSIYRPIYTISIISDAFKNRRLLVSSCLSVRRNYSIKFYKI